MAPRPPKPPLPPLAERKLSRLKLLWRFARAYPLQLGAAITALCVAALTTLAIPQGLKTVVDNGFARGSDPDAIAPFFLGFLGLVLMLGLATSVRFFFVSWIGERVVADLRTAVQRHLVSLDPVFFEENRPAEIASRITSDTSVIEQVVGTSASLALRNTVMGIGGIGYMFWVSPRLTLMMLLVIPLTIAPIFFLGRKVRDISRASQDRVADMGTMVSEVLGAIRIVQAFTQEGRESSRFAAAVERSFDTAKRRIRLRAVMTALVITLVFGAITLVLWQGALDVISGQLSGGSIAAFVFAAAIVAGAFGTLRSLWRFHARCRGRRTHGGIAGRPPNDPCAGSSCAAAHPGARRTGTGRRAFPLPVQARCTGAQRLHAEGGARRNGGSGRSLGRRQIHAVPARAALL